jgi:FtsH-binding integral membrane protein
MVAMLAAAAPAARDAGFEIAVLARIERRRFRRALLLWLGQALAAALVMTLLMLALAPVWDWMLNAVSRTLPLRSWLQSEAANLVLGIALMAVSLVLPWWRRA